MSLVLYDLPHSPYCLPIKRILEALKVPFKSEDVPNWDRRKVIELTQGAYYQVPVLHHDEQVIFESGTDTNDVARYVDATFAGGRLFPPEHQGLQVILVRYLDDEVEGATFRACDAFYVDSIGDLVNRGMVLRHKERKFGRGCVAQWKSQIDEIRAGAASHFARFDARLRQHPWLLGAEPVYADFLLYGIVSNYTWNSWNELPPEMTALQSWFEKMKTFSF
ncbi:MAG TPA: glutathione S-transferase family protein [Verrucomicrobiaceae bacterium]